VLYESRDFHLGNLLQLSRDTIEIDPLAWYKQITIKLNHKGVALRKEVAGIDIKSKQYCVKSGQFIISRIDARNGAMGVIPQELNGAVVTNDFLNYDINADLVHPQFLELLARTKKFVLECKKASEGTTNRVRLSPDKFLDIRISLPSLPQQNLIVLKFQRIERLVGKSKAYRTHVESPEALWKSILRKAFEGNLVPQVTNDKLARKPLQQPRDLKRYNEARRLNSPTDLTKSGESPWESDPQVRIPNSWKTVPFADLGEWRGGGTPSKLDYSNWQNGEIPWVTPKDMKAPYITDTRDRITKKALKTSAVAMIPAGSVLFVVRSSILKHTLPVAINTIDVTINQDLKALIPANRVRSDYLRYVTQSFNEHILESCKKLGTTVESIEVPKLKQYRVPLPPLGEQQLIVAKIEQFGEKIAQARQLIIDAEEEADRIIPNLLERLVTLNSTTLDANTVQTRFA
jgi:type I restriction enzyme, S subunit